MTSGQVIFVTSPMLSQWEIFQNRHFWWKLSNYFTSMACWAIHNNQSANFHGWPVQDCLGPWWRHQRLSAVFLAIYRDREPIETSNHSQSICLVHTHLMICIMTYFGEVMSWPDLDQSSNFEIDLSRSCHRYIIRTSWTRETRWWYFHCNIFARY